VDHKITPLDMTLPEILLCFFTTNGAVNEKFIAKVGFSYFFSCPSLKIRFLSFISDYVGQNVQC